MEITNKKIIKFFNDRPNLDFEDTILKFIDIMEKLQENIDKSITNTNVSEILNSMNLLNIKLENNKLENQKILSKELEKINKDMEINMLKIITDMRLKVNEEVKNFMITTCNNSLEPKLKESIETTQIKALNVLTTKLNDILDIKMQPIYENKDIISKQDIQLNELLKKFENSSIKGQITENLLYNILTKLYEKAEINIVGKTNECCDIEFVRNNKPKILIESKSWGKTVPKGEVEKFERDIITRNCNGIFISVKYSISCKNNFEINIINGNILVYISEFNYDLDHLKIGIDLLDQFYDKYKELKKDLNDDDNISVDKEFVDLINSEYANFIYNKNNAIKYTKESFQKVLKHIEQMNMPSIEKFLSINCNNSNIKEFKKEDITCIDCGFVGKKPQSMPGHYRCCQLRINRLKKEKEVKNMVIQPKTINIET